MSRKWDAANFAASIVLVCVFLTVANATEGWPGKASALAVAALLVVRAAWYGGKLRAM